MMFSDARGAHYLIVLHHTDADIIYARTDMPEKNREAFILKVANVKKKKKVHDMIIVMMPALLGDIDKNIKAKLVENNCGLLIQWPSVSHPFMYEFSQILKGLKRKKNSMFWLVRSMSSTMMK